MKVLVEKKEKICTIQINRPNVRNAVDRETAQQLAEALRDFENDENLNVAVLYGMGGTFCAGADLKAFSIDDGNRLEIDMSKDGPMGPSRMNLSKPVIAAVSGHAVAGGLELAIWCDLRIVERDAIFGVFCRRFGVPLIDGGTQRLPRLIGMSRALDMILTGRPVGAEEALSMGLANRIVEVGTVKEEAEKLAAQIAQYPQLCMKNDRKAVYEGFDLDFEKAMQLEFTLGMIVVQSGESKNGAKRFAQGHGKHGIFNN
ncbi:crotonase/enoyl-CoA hydratase family protein [Neobacillus sp. PS2-9]|uniref:crotonase/enoyl-CoA hydratase family protein n=1 Tax=Neobacillus sp. PS2-9 TaxID=3070676 RepID=UPI0027E05210|nr:crotonase/enoyl-CoA hydratase family protein [Neobacillus sp. PS2-9]WML57103.1 crotonase/enoyl-CoA hydratase family protein [Neobacillus sp. PS2-9]